MYEHLFHLNSELNKIRTYLVKIGPSRRKGEIVLRKIKEADNLVGLFNTSLEKLEQLRPNLKEDECLKIEQLITSFFSLYDSILDLCTITSTKEYSNNVETMAKFDLKIALSILPVLTDDETSVKQLIDGIEYYQSELDQEGQTKLINFVLKSRLSQAAKLKLNNKYDSVDSLIKAIRSQLLPKKSATALQHKLLNLRQNDLSVNEFGKQITDLFVNLTITQSEGNEASYSVLKPLNEKLAIKSFADGLRNRRLSTIIAARNFSCLSDAVQAAIDEEVSSPSTSADILTMRRNGYSNSYQSRNYRGQHRNSRGESLGRGTQSHDEPPPQDNNSRSGHGRGYDRAPRSSRGTKGRTFYNQTRNSQPQRQQQMHVLEESDSRESQIQSEDSEIPEKFFRE